MKRYILLLNTIILIGIHSAFAQYDFKTDGIGYSIIDEPQKQVSVTYYESPIIIVPDNVIYNGNTYTIVDAIYYDTTTCAITHFDKIDFSNATNITQLYDQTTSYIDIDTLILPPNITFFPSFQPVEKLVYDLLYFNADTIQRGIHRIFSSGTTQIKHDGFYFTSNSRYLGTLKMLTGAFSFNTALQEVDLSTHEILTISDRAFYGARFLEKCKLPSTIVNINRSAFFFCTSLKQINLEDLNNLESIAISSFYATKLDSFYIGKNVKNINVQLAASSVRLKKIVVHPDNTNFRCIDDVLFDWEGKTLVAYPSAKEGTTYTIPEGTEIINGYAFAGTIDRIQHLETLVFASSINTIQLTKSGDAVRLLSLDPQNEWYDDINKSHNLYICPFAYSTIKYFENFENTQIEEIPALFLYFTKVRYLVLPPTVKKINTMALFYCPELTYIDFSKCGNHLETMMNHTLNNVPALMELDLSTLTTWAKSPVSTISGGDTINTIVLPHDIDTLIVTSNVIGYKKINQIICPFKHPWSLLSPTHKLDENGKPDSTIIWQYTPYSLFWNVDKPNCTLIVPEESIEEFKSTPIWQDFKISAGDGVEIGICTVHAYSSDSTKGTVVGGGTYPLNHNIHVQAFAKEGYIFDHWSDGNTTNPRTELVNKKEITITAIFREKEKYKLNLISNNNLFGDVYGTGEYFEGDIIRIRAIPHDGHFVYGWSFATYRRSNAMNFTMPRQDTTIVVYFSNEDGTVDTTITDTTKTHIDNIYINQSYNYNETVNNNEIMYIFNSNGILLYAGEQKLIDLPRQHTYIIKIGDMVRKIYIP